jgi:hypothetical protein
MNLDNLFLIVCIMSWLCTIIFVGALIVCLGMTWAFKIDRQQHPEMYQMEIVK